MQQNQSYEDDYSINPDEQDSSIVPHHSHPLQGDGFKLEGCQNGQVGLGGDQFGNQGNLGQDFGLLAASGSGCNQSLSKERGNGGISKS